MLRFVTGNEGKVREAREYLPRSVEQVSYDYAEVQADDLEPIAARGAREAFRELGGRDPVFVEDSGLFIDALDGFPGPYSAYVEDTLGIERVAGLVDEADDARFRSVIAFAYDPESNLPAGSPGDSGGPDWHDGPAVEDGVAVVTFDGVVRGRIVPPRGEGGFGYDPIFEHNGRTLAEMSTEEKNAVSHRGRALSKLADWLDSQDA